MYGLYKDEYGQRILAVLDSDDSPLFFRIQRDSMLNYGEVVMARITQKNALLRGYFAETDKKLPVFISTQQSFCEGDYVKIQIIKEARLGKDATAKIADSSLMLGMPSLQDDLVLDTILPDAQNNIDMMIDEALETDVSFADGACLHIERTQSCWCIDIDTAKSTLSFSEINEQACAVIKKQIFLKNMAGMILIDFAGFKHFSEQKKLTKGLFSCFETEKQITLYGFTKMRLFELKRTRTTTALADLFLTREGKKHPAGLVPVIMRHILRCKKGKAVLVIHPTLLSWLPENIYTYCTVQADSNCALDSYEIKGE